MKDSNWSLGADLTVQLRDNFVTPVLANGAPDGDKMPAHAFGSTRELSIERARLISAAPDLFRVAEFTLDCLDMRRDGFTNEKAAAFRARWSIPADMTLDVFSRGLVTDAIAKATKGGGA